MDETKRDIYNRFGPESLQFDPRTDEFKLLTGLGIIYVFWGVMLYTATLNKGARGSRTWSLLVLIAMLLSEVFLCLTQSSLPTWMPATLTEREFVDFLHSLYPGIIVCLRCLSEYLYVDIDRVSAQVLSELAKHQKVIQFILVYLSRIVFL